MNQKETHTAATNSAPSLRTYKSGSDSVSVIGNSRTTAKWKRDTDHYLQYYHSSLADGATSDGEQDAAQSPILRRQVSRDSASPSPSDYSSDSEPARPFTKAVTTNSRLKRRSGTISEGGSDRRRLAIVQMDTVAEVTERSTTAENSHGSGSLRSRRGLPSNLAGLVLVAPPDAAVNSYNQLSHPSTAPITGDVRMSGSSSAANSHSEKGHQRSASEAVHPKRKSSRDVGIVGTDRMSPSLPKQENLEARVSANKSNVLHLPIFQQPQSRSPSPGTISDASDHVQRLSPAHVELQMDRRSTEQLIVTPGIGEGKDIGTPVAGPVVVNLDFPRSPQTMTHKATPTPKTAVQQPADPIPAIMSSYLHYQPGIHATAGPLPPPPRATFNIDPSSPAPPRPPRLNSPHPPRTRGDIEAVKQALQLPPSVSAALASRSPKSITNKPLNISQTDVSDATVSDLYRVKSVHRREGAFSPSAPATFDSDVASQEDNSLMVDNAQHIMDNEVPPVTAIPPVINDDQGPSITIIQPLLNDKGPPITIIQPLKRVKHDSDESDHERPAVAPTVRRKSDELSLHSDSRSLSPPYSGHSGETPSPPPKSLRNSLTTNLKRFSTLPRPPSISSKSARRSSGGTHYSSRTPSPSLVHTPLTPRMKIKSQYPTAMYCTEVYSRKTVLERCTVYAQKINELYMYDCGLGDWIIKTKLRANTNRPIFPAQSFTPQPRHTSRASMISEATFPRRPDASIATDLSVRTQDLAPAVPPALPYPSLAQAQFMYPARSSSLASSTPPSSIRSLAPSTPVSKTGGFFASLGRKASLSSAKGTRPVPGSPASSSGGKLHTKNSPSTSARVVNISNAPSVPGGPRAPPQRILRSQTIIATTNPFASNSPTSEHHDTLGRRPSLSNFSQGHVIDIQADPDFVRQVDKLVDLLPHADRAVLAGYLRRAGQDILAIGQYLEDEKNGTLKT